MGTWDQALFLKVLLSPVVLAAAWTTVWVATVAQALGTAIGFALAPLLNARLRLFRVVGFLYVWIFRGTPLLAQILFFYAVLPQLGLRLGVVPTGLLALGLNEGARMSEVVRSGLLSVPQDQREAARALGFRPWQVLVLVVLPQALRVMVAPLGNNYSYMIKATSLLSAISFAELLRVSQQLAQSTARPLEVYCVAALYYLVIVSVVTIVQRVLEARVHRRTGEVSTPHGQGEAASTPLVLPKHSVDRPALAAGPVVIEAKGVSKVLGGTRALDKVDFQVRRGEVVAIVGRSGSGKSTLLRCLNHLEVPDEGVVMFEGTPVGGAMSGPGLERLLTDSTLKRQRKRIGVVFQRFNLFPHLTARDNVALAFRKVGGLQRKEARLKAGELLATLGLERLADRFPAELSGGQRQRVAIARALAQSPSLLLFDEPTSALDPESVGEVLDAIQDLAKRGTTMVIVTHELGFARALADRIVVMDAGRIVSTNAA